MLRVALFLATNLAVILVASITLRLLGAEQYLYGSGWNLTYLLVFCAVFGMGGSIISLLLSKWAAKKFTGAHVIVQPADSSERWLLDTVKELSHEAGIKTPETAVFPAEQSNAFATGRNRNDALVAVSVGLLRRFDKDEIRAVLAHEIGHIANGDMVTLALLQGVLNTFVMLFARIIGSVVDRAVLKSESGHGIGYWVVSIAAEIVLGFLALIIVMWFSRQREYRADAMGARLAGAGAMISALERLKAESQLPDQMPESLTAFGITDGVRTGFKKLFVSHPPLEDRIRALKTGKI